MVAFLLANLNPAFATEDFSIPFREKPILGYNLNKPCMEADKSDWCLNLGSDCLFGLANSDCVLHSNCSFKMETNMD